MDIHLICTRFSILCLYIYIYTYIPWCSPGLFARHHTPQSIVGKFYSQTFSQTPHVTTVWLGLCTTIGMLFQHTPANPRLSARHHAPLQCKSVLHASWLFLRHHAPGHNLPALCCTLLWCVVPVKYSWVVNAR